VKRRRASVASLARTEAAMKASINYERGRMKLSEELNGLKNYLERLKDNCVW
jgi:hypothetical protein